MQQGDRVGIWSPNCYEWTLLQFATAQVGLILVNLNLAYTAQELAFVLEQTTTKIVFAPNAYKTSAYKEMLLTAQNNIVF